jgi:hypothetical protein
MLHTIFSLVPRALKAAGLLTLLASLTGQAQAGFIAYGSSLSVSAGASKAEVVASVDSPDQIVNVVTDGGTTIRLDTSNYQIEPSDVERLNITPEGTDITIGDINVFTTASTPAENGVSFNFDFTLDLLNFKNSIGGVANGETQLKVSGMITANIGPGRSSMMRTVSYAFEPSNGIFQVGTDMYQIAAFNFVPPGARGDAGRFSITLKSLQPVPEPGSLVLLGLGGVVGLFGLTRRARAAKTAAVEV